MSCIAMGECCVLLPHQSPSCSRVSFARAEARRGFHLHVICRGLGLSRIIFQPITARVIEHDEPSMNPSTSIPPPPFAAAALRIYITKHNNNFTSPAFACRFHICHTSQWQPYEHTARPCNQSSDSPRNLHRPADALSASKRKDALSRHSAHAYSLTNVL